MSKIKKVSSVFAVALFLLCIFSVKVARTCDSQNIKITKTGPDCVVPGGTITYEVCIFSEESNDVDNVFVVDKIPFSTTYQTIFVGGSENNAILEELMACEPDAPGGYTPCIRWSFGTVPPRTILCETFTVEVPADTEVGQVITNKACGFAHYCSTDICSNIVSTEVKESCDEGIGCRVTGGGNDTAGLAIDGVSWDGTLAYKKKPSGKSITVSGNGADNTYTFGGQAGANTGQQPQPKGEWTHHQKSGYYGSFTFHAGTASAPEGTEIDLIECSDPDFCNPARPAPAKQIDFEGVGSFKNLRSKVLKDQIVVGESLHWFNVHIEDLGEPGKNGQHAPEPDPKICPPGGSGGGLANCDCPDFYHIKIYPASPDLSNPIMTGPPLYEVWGYINGGNFQIHPPTGFDLK
jgi:hypothetical protein